MRINHHRCFQTMMPRITTKIFLQRHPLYVTLAAYFYSLLNHVVGVAARYSYWLWNSVVVRRSLQKVQGHRTAQGHRAGNDVDVTPPTRLPCGTSPQSGDPV